MKKAFCTIICGFVVTYISFGSVVLSDPDGDGFLDISSFNDLCEFAENQSYWDKNIELTCDIDATETHRHSFNSGFGWTPIGGDGYNAPPFSGVFEGNGFAIIDLCINNNKNKSSEQGTGFFGYLDSAHIASLSLTNVDFRGGMKVAGIASNLKFSTINKCKVSGKMEGSVYMGGIAAFVEQSNISNCSFSGILKGKELIGGICGHAKKTFISKCKAYPSIKGYSLLAGISATLSRGSLIKSNAFIDIKGEDIIGGLIGISDSSSISCNYVVGEIKHTGILKDIGIQKNSGGAIGMTKLCFIDNCYTKIYTNKHIAGFVGTYADTIQNCYSSSQYQFPNNSAGFAFKKAPKYLNNNSFIKNCFWDMERSGVSFSFAGTPKTTTEMKNKKTYIEAGWDFEKIWDIDPDINEGYPYLRDNPPPKEKIKD